MHSHLVTAFYDTLGNCFDKVVKQINPNLPTAVYDHLAQSGMTRADVSVRFDLVMVVLTKWLGAGARIIGLQTLRELYSEYATPASFDGDSTIGDAIVFLRERVLALHLAPKSLHLGTPDQTPMITRSR